MIKETIILKAEEEDKNKRLDIFIEEELENYSRSFIQKLIENGNVLIENYKKLKNGLKLKGNENIQINIPENDEIDILPENIRLNIIYEDNDIVIINKEAGIVVHPAPGNYSGTLVNAILYHINSLSTDEKNLRPGIVHRLDKDTSGLIIIAKNDISHWKLAEMFKERKINKEYIAIVNGQLKIKKGRIETLIGRDHRDRKKMAVVLSNGKIAITNYEVIDENEKASLLRLKIETGRTHQIRVHMKYIGHPIVGDITYGLKKEAINFKRQMLHSYKLEFIHPITNDRLFFLAELPDDFKECAEKLKIDLGKV